MTGSTDHHLTPTFLYYYQTATMYEFDLVVKQSAIPGANLGAFITFTQAFGRNGTSKTSETYDTPMDQQTFFDGRNLSIDLGKYHRKEGKLQTTRQTNVACCNCLPKVVSF